MGIYTSTIQQLQADIDLLLTNLRQHLKITDGPLTRILGYRVTDLRSSIGTIRLDMDEYAELIKKELGDYIPPGSGVDKPMQPSCFLSKTQGPSTVEELAAMEEIPYRKITAMLMYYQIAMRLDISFPVGKCARYMANPGMSHWRALQRILKWIETHPNAYLEFRQPKDDALRNVLVWFVDSDWASDPDDMKSTLGHIGYINGAPFLWVSRKQKCQASSSGEAEVKAAHGCSLDAMYFRQFMEEIGFFQPPNRMYEDNNAALAYISDPLVRGRMKHIHKDYHVIKEFVESGYIHPIKIDTSLNVADGLTKAQATADFEYFLSQTLHFGFAR